MTDTFIDISRRLAVRLPSPRWFVSPRRTATLQPGALNPACRSDIGLAASLMETRNE